MSRFTAGVLAAVRATTAYSYEPIEELGAGDLTSTAYAVDERVIAEWHANQKRVPVACPEIPIHVIDAVVAGERLGQCHCHSRRYKSTAAKAYKRFSA